MVSALVPAASAGFLPTSPLRGTTHGRECCGLEGGFLPTSPLRGTTQYVWSVYDYEAISIHVPLAGDDAGRNVLHGGIGISIHVPLAGDDRIHY